jgi:NhaP-type Na+/H+ or K+/H+ antiporter
MHVSGEALLNDGSAYVFYTIFKARYFFAFGIPGIGQDVNWGEGFKLFFQLALGGMCIGLAFGIGSVILLFALYRRLSGEDSLAQVVVTISAAYLAYFSSEVAGCSGIISVLFLGVTVKSLGFTMINDPHLMMHFWEVVEWLLNTLLFTLAGGLWGYLMVRVRK